MQAEGGQQRVLKYRQKIVSAYGTIYCDNSTAGGKVLLTRGITSLDPNLQQRIVCAVLSFKDFTTDNDPNGEHDCAILSVEGLRILFKIDYYDPAMLYASEDPTDSRKTARVMTIMLTEEY